MRRFEVVAEWPSNTESGILSKKFPDLMEACIYFYAVGEYRGAKKRLDETGIAKIFSEREKCSPAITIRRVNFTPPIKKCIELTEREELAQLGILGKRLNAFDFDPLEVSVVSRQVSEEEAAEIIKVATKSARLPIEERRLIKPKEAQDKPKYKYQPQRKKSILCNGVEYKNANEAFVAHGLTGNPWVSRCTQFRSIILHPKGAATYTHPEAPGIVLQMKVVYRD